MKADFVNPFIQAAREVLSAELGADPTRGQLSVQNECYTTDDIAVMLGVTGSVVGNVVFGLDLRTALAIVTRMMGQAFEEFDALAQSGIGELANVVTGRAATLLAEAGYPCDISPPSLLIGAGSKISTISMPRLVIPLHASIGPIEIQVALRDARTAEMLRRSA